METKELTALRVGLASPETIKSWSYGEVLKPETINYRRLRPEKDGLFCEAIFGPSRDWQCYCGKYKNIRYKGITCDKCGVEVTRSSVRRERMGHIDLAAPVAHVWYTRRVPSYMGLLLNISRRNLERVLYFAQYIVTHVDAEARDRALKRLEEEIGMADNDQGELLNTKMAELKMLAEQRINGLNTQIESLKARYDEEIANKLQPIMSEGQRQESDLRDSMGTTSATAITFHRTGEEIVPAGEKIANKHISKVQEIVSTALSDIEKELKGQQEREIEHLKMEIEKTHADLDLTMRNMQDELQEQAEAHRAEAIAKRDELLDLRTLTFMGELKYRDLKSKWGNVFRADMGAEAFYDILSRLDLDKLSEELWTELRTSRSKQKRKKATRRLKVVEAFRQSGNRPEWMIMAVIPVIPPELRPMVQLDGGRFATSDLNDLYRRVINRNNRLKRLLELGAPDVIVRNEKRMLQEAVDSLIDNSQRGKALSRRGRRELKSLSDMLKGKKGRFRRNLLGKRVDYSGRSVIVVGPKLKLYQCGLPKKMALELFRPFVIARLVSHNYAANVKGAKRFIERNRPEVWEVLEEVIKERPVLLNRAPTLHRLGIQAFEPILIEGNAIHLHPLVTTAFNADFDGDQMAVHVPLSEQAVKEARHLMLSSRNLLKPADGEPIISPSKDMVLGVFYLTITDDRPYRGDGLVFGNMKDVSLAYELNLLDIHANIKLRVKTWYSDDDERLDEPETRIIDTTVGRVIFNTILPDNVQYVNRQLDKGGVKDLFAEVYEYCGTEITTQIADKIKDIGFHYATRSGTTVAIADITIPEEKPEIVQYALKEVEVVDRNFRRGLLTETEQNQRIIEIWQEANSKISSAVRKTMDPMGNLSTMATSGATKGGFTTISQLAGMKGMVADPSGRIIPLPIRSNFREGLTALEYFISTHGSRKGLADTALRTADAGYLTRRLVDVAQDVIVRAQDCDTDEGLVIHTDDDIAGQSMGGRIYGRLLAKRVVSPETGEILAERNVILDNDVVRRIVNAGVVSVLVRSPLTCELDSGVCANCYGLDMGRGQVVDSGSAVGIVAAQSIGEPGTQLTLRTFHTGGVASGADITTGLPRVEELLEARKTPKGEAVISEIGGTVSVEQSDRYSELRIIRVEHSEMISDTYDIPEEWTIEVEDATEVKEGAVLASFEEAKVTAQKAGRARIEGQKVIVSYEIREEEEYDIPSGSRLLVRDGDTIEAGDPLTEGSLNPHNLLRLRGREDCMKYLLNEVQKVYRSQGQNIHDKHFETIIRKMMSRAQVTRPGDSTFLPGDIVNRLELRKENEKLLAEGKQPSKSTDMLLGITKASLTTESFLSAASFQHTIRVLAGAAIASTEDPLHGLKENVIIGKLIPAGTGYEDMLVKEAAALALAEEGADVKDAVSTEAPEGLGEAEAVSAD